MHSLTAERSLASEQSMTVMKMTDAELLSQLIAGGCLVQTNGGGLRDVGCAGLIEGACWWVELFPEDQHNVRCTPYVRSRQFHDRDLALYDESGVIVLYFAPHGEWPELDVDRYLQTWVRWQKELSISENCQRLTRFVQNCLGLQVEL